jgi:peptidoglycan-associated lipoprotein
MRIRIWRSGVSVIGAVVIAATACGKKPPVQPPPPPAAPPPVVQATPTPPPPPPARPTPTPTPPPAPRVPTEDEIFAKKTAEEVTKELGVAYFEYDAADLTDAARGTLQKNSDLMRRWTSIRVMIEGHADSRGTNEYNLALGERRASAARDYIVSLGIPAARITIVSKGEEAPDCRDESEACWQLNRRAYFVVTAK